MLSYFLSHDVLDTWIHIPANARSILSILK